MQRRIFLGASLGALTLGAGFYSKYGRPIKIAGMAFACRGGGTSLRQDADASEGCYVPCGP